MLMPITIFMTIFYHNSKLYHRVSSVLFSKSALILTTALLMVMVFIVSCEEKPTTIGLNLLPGQDFIKVKPDTSLHAEVFTLPADSIMTNSRTYSYIGNLTDPYFGDSKADFVAQLRLDTAWSGFKKWPGGQLPAIDSAKLYFTISGAKGKLDSTTIHKIKIYEITESLNSTSKYYSNRDPRAGKELGTISLPAFPKDSTKSIAVRLPDSIGEYLLRDTTMLYQDKDGNPFKSFFKGIYVTMVDSPDPILLTMSFSSPNFGITVYYHDTQWTSYYFSFAVKPTSVRYNRYYHNYATATSPYKLPLNRIKQGLKDSMVYLQSFYGVYPKINITGFSPIKKMLWDSVRNIPLGSINKARLTFSVFLDDNTYTDATVPTQILMKYIVSDTAQYLVPDYQVNPSFFDGKFNATSKTYSFNLASFLQEYLKGKIPQPVVYMYFPEGIYKNVILKANNSKSPVKFEFTYTKF